MDHETHQRCKEMSILMDEMVFAYREFGEALKRLRVLQAELWRRVKPEGPGGSDDSAAPRTDS